MSRLLARCALSGLAAKSSMAAASMASWRRCARSISRSSRHRAQRKSPASRIRYAQRRHPPSAASAARLRRQLAARRSRHGWQACAKVPSFLTAAGLRHPLSEHSGAGTRRSIAGGTKPSGSFPLRWSMRVDRSMSISCSGVATRCASVLNGRHARAGRSPRTSEVEAQRRTVPVDRASTRATLGGNDGRKDIVVAAGTGRGPLRATTNWSGATLEQTDYWRAVLHGSDRRLCRSAHPQGFRIGSAGSLELPPPPNRARCCDRCGRVQRDGSVVALRPSVRGDPRAI